MPERDDALLDYATERQAEILSTWWGEGNTAKAATRLGVHRTLFGKTLAAVRKRAARLGYAPGHFAHGVAAGYAMGKVTVQRGADGSVERVWERQHPAAEDMAAALRDMVDALKNDIPRAEPIPTPEFLVDDKLCNVFTLTDAHIGALAWHREGGANWNLQIAEAVILGAFRHMIASAPRARRAVVVFLGDLQHQDSNKAVTPAHGHLLDADSRPRKTFGAVVRIMREIIAMAAATHPEVHVVAGEGNHDEYTAGTVLPEVFEIFYENEPRVEVNDSRLPYYVMQWGSTMLAWHHGHKKPPVQMPLYFATAHARMWGDTVKRYCHLGHRHHVEEKEHSGMKTVQHSTLAARDAHAARGGWFSERQALRITYHADFGEVSRETVTPEMLAA